MHGQKELPDGISLSYFFCPHLVRKISHFRFSRLVKFQHKLDFQLRRSSYFLKKRKEIMYIFSNPHLFLELVLQYSKLTKVYNIVSSSSNIRSAALLFRECLKILKIPGFCPHFGKLNFRAKLS